ncbi:hypothetical protein ABMA28_005263 [Loxostege sticticalis]|uniref:Uncharacterized protein n=1 Tax=Loxostege sticticalis TaxID=481309 RepID=A0ABD0SPT8_LOXSC
MNEKKSNSSSRISENSPVVLKRDASVSTNRSQTVEDVETSTQTTEDDVGLQYSLSKHRTEISGIDKEPMFVLVDSSAISSDPSSKELLIRENAELRDTVLRKYFNKYVKPANLPSTSRELSIPPHQIRESESKEEVQMVDINLQSENDIPIDDDVNDKPLSETSLDVIIPSYPGSQRSLNVASDVSLEEWEGAHDHEHEPLRRAERSLREAVEYLHRDNEFLEAAEVGNDRLLEMIMKAGTDVHAVDHVGRTALHLAVCADSFRAITLLLEAGVNPAIRDRLGMTPLSICLMRRPSLKVAKLLFEYGAKLIPRSDPMNTGLFIQFVMMCEPTAEEEKTLRLLVEKGALVNDPEAPGGRQALHFAAMSNNCKLIEILIDLGASLFMRNHKSQTPREVAMTYRCRNAQALLEFLEEESDTTIASGATFGTIVAQLEK